jgi:DNA-binding NarL/FixJ family response regulator
LKSLSQVHRAKNFLQITIFLQTAEAGLTPREVQVAKLVCMGLNNSQISKKIGICYNTVRAHLVNIFGKMGVKGKAGLILGFIETIQKAKL